jgi:hypothetical protein
MERDPLAKRDQYETDDEIREQPAWSEPNISPDIEQQDGDWAFTGPHDADGHGAVDDEQSQGRKRQTT